MVAGGPQVASCGVGFSGIVVHWRDSAAFWARDVDTGGWRCLGVRLVGALGWWWARVDDESKRRCQGLVVCRATLPFEGFCDARPGVTLAPTFAVVGLAARQSRTVRV